MTKTGNDVGPKTKVTPTIKMVDFLRAVAATQPTAENPEGSTMKNLLGALRPHYPSVAPTDVMHIRNEAMPLQSDEATKVDVSKQLVEKIGYHHTLTEIGKQVLADLEAVEAAAKDIAQESVEA